MFDFSPVMICLSLFFSIIGIGYCSYGKKSGVPHFRSMGWCLMLFPYLVDKTWLLCLIGTGLAALPYLLLWLEIE